MLDIYKHKKAIPIDDDRFGAWRHITDPKAARTLAYWLLGFLAFLIILMFLPWTQNIRSVGKLTTLTPEDRPMQLQTRIDGRIEKWYVREGDTVLTGDTIVFISEIKDAYFDPALLQRTREQIEAKESMGRSYQEKIKALEDQIQSERSNLQLRLKMARNRQQMAQRRVSIDSAEVQASLINFQISEEQLLRGEEMFKKGVMSLRDVESRRNRMQEARAKLISAENKYANTQQELINATIDLNSIEQDFLSKIFKIESDLGSAMSELFKTDEEISKMENNYTNYSIRSRYYHITAPRDGQVVKIVKSGIGETVAAGDAIATLTSLQPNLAVELYVRPVDLPLIRIGTQARIIFDGWPTIVFSGWPGVSIGTFGAQVSAMDSDISSNGKYRILVSPDPNEEPWPEQLRVGAGAQGLSLLNTVPIWYEIWRQINGFPPDYYYDENLPPAFVIPQKEKKKK